MCAPPCRRGGDPGRSHGPGSTRLERFAGRQLCCWFDFWRAASGAVRSEEAGPGPSLRPIDGPPVQGLRI